MTVNKLICVLAYRSTGNRLLEQWLRHLVMQGETVRYAPDTSPVELCREQICNRFLAEDAPCGRTHVVMIDADMVPLPQTEAILVCPNELAYCGYVGSHGRRGHLGDGDFGCACCSIAADLLRRVAKPWFWRAIDNDVVVNCECTNFAQAAGLVGAEPFQAGIVGHLQQGVLVPGRAGGVPVVWWNWDIDTGGAPGWDSPDEDAARRAGPEGK